MAGSICRRCWAAGLGEPVTNLRVTPLKLIEQQTITLGELWIQYWASGGNARRFELESFPYGAYELCPFENTVIAWALEDLTVA